MCSYGSSGTADGHLSLVPNHWQCADPAGPAQHAWPTAVRQYGSTSGPAKLSERLPAVSLDVTSRGGKIKNQIGHTKQGHASESGRRIRHLARTGAFCAAFRHSLARRVDESRAEEYFVPGFWPRLHWTLVQLIVQMLATQNEASRMKHDGPRNRHLFHCRFSG